MNRKKQIRLILTIVFWVTLYIIVKSQKFEITKNPYLTAITYLTFIFHIWYEGIYKKNKIENKKTEIKNKHLAELKNKQDELSPQIKNKDLPNELIELIPLFKKWGIENKILRDNLYESASNGELLELKSIEVKRDLIEKWIENNSDKPKTSKALNLTLKSYDELGLWTWDNK